MPNRLSFGIGGIALALSVAASPIHAGQDPVITASEDGAYNLAACEVRAAPHCDDAAAQYDIGMMYKDGLCVPSDPVSALGWFLCAARSDGKIGRDATIWAERLSSSLGGPAVMAAQKKLLGCRRLAEIAPQPGTGEASQRPETGKRSIWKTLKIKLDQFTGVLSRFETARPNAGAPADRTAAPEPPKFGTQATVTMPDRRNIWSRVFFLPADGTIVGSQHIARNLGANDLFRDVREIAQNSNNFTLGLFAVFWWVLIGKSLLSIGRALMGGGRRPGARRLGQNGWTAPRH